MVMISVWCVYPGCLLGNGSLCEYDEVVWPLKVGTWWEWTRSSGTLPAGEIGTLIQFILRKELFLRKSSFSLCSVIQSHSGIAFSLWTHTALFNRGSNQKLINGWGHQILVSFQKKKCFQTKLFALYISIPEKYYYVNLSELLKW